MCIMALQKPEATILSDEIITRCSKYNNDGYGIMWIENNELKIKKGIEINPIIEEYKRVKEKIKDTPVALHFRAGTSGGNTKENCHPFYINKDYAFMHNGFISVDIPENKKKTYSDTRYFGEFMLSPLAEENILNNETTLTLIENFIEIGNKIIILSKDKTFKILHENEGMWEDKTWFSNSQYQKYDYKGSCGSVYSNYYDNYVPCAACNSYEKSKVMVKFDTFRKTFYICLKCLKKENKSVKDFFSNNEKHKLF